MIAIEPPEKLSDHDLETILNIWNRKPRRISIKVHVHIVYPLSFHNKIVKKINETWTLGGAKAPP